MSSQRELAAHPLAEVWLISTDALNDVRESIRANGLRHPIVVDVEGRIIDGRTRYQACLELGISPEVEVYEGDDILEYIQDANNGRRHVSTAARAISVAQMLVLAGKRKGGKWVYGALTDSTEVYSSSFRSRLNEAGVVLDWRPDLVGQVKDGSLPLNVAYERAKDTRDKVDTARRAQAIEATRKREATAKEHEENDRKLAALTKDQSKFLASIEDGSMSIPVAYAAHIEDTRKAREDVKMERANGIQAASALARAVSNLGFLRYPQARTRNIQQFNAYKDEVPELQRKEVTPDNLRTIAELLPLFAEEIELASDCLELQDV